MWTTARWKAIGAASFLVLDYTVSVLVLFALGLFSFAFIRKTIVETFYPNRQNMGARPMPPTRSAA